MRAIRMCVDRVFSPAQIVSAGHRSVREDPRNAPLVRPSEPGGALRQLRMGATTKHLWRDRRVLRVRFLEGDRAVRKKVQTYAEHWSEHCGITFSFGDQEGAEIRIAFGDDGSWSWVGNEALEVTDPTEPTMNFGWLTAATPDIEYSEVVLHQFGHALGCIHEHQQPAAQIPWDKAAVYEYYAKPPNRWKREDVDSNIFERYAAGDTQFTQFDDKSIMLYAIDEELTHGNYAVDWNPVLSETDKSYIGVLYAKRERTITPLQVDAEPTSASIGTHGEQDMFEFFVTQAGAYTIETFGRTDVVASLRGPEKDDTVIAFDDDSGRGRNAKLEADLKPGKYFLRVEHFRPRGTGRYSVGVNRGQ